MGVRSAIAEILDRLGARPLVAWLATQAYRRRSGGNQRFSVDGEGRWVNQSPEAVIVSPVPHTSSFPAFRDWVLDHWAHRYRPKEGDIVVDVGSGVGEEAVIFSIMVGKTGRVIAIEAHPGVYACLQETVRRSSLTNVETHLVALSDHDGEVRIVEGGVHLTHSIFNDGDGAVVPARSLGSLMRECKVERIDLLKMNIEGAEKGAVEGLRDFKGVIRHVIISCHDFLADRTGNAALRTRDSVRAMLTEGGFSLSDRPDHDLPWVRDYLYGERTEAQSSKG